MAAEDCAVSIDAPTMMDLQTGLPILQFDAAWNQAGWRSKLRRVLLEWFAQHRRDLPWRRTRDPYAIWISEVMLQQTQVTTVIPYYERFLQRFPSVTTLAEASEAEVLRLWEGLGYYRRAKQMHAAARKVVEQHHGNFPVEFEQVLALPGIGRYTAGAILSIATGKRYPVVEANTMRLYSRLIALRNPPTQPAAAKLLWEVAETLLPRAECGEFNQAAMELGALVCVPANPKCDECPLKSCCPARRLGLQQQIPGKLKKVNYEDRRHWAIIVQREGQFFMRLCPPGGHWAGLWDFPRYDITEVDDPSGFISQAFADEFGWRVQIGEAPIASIRHGVTRFRIQLEARNGSARASQIRELSRSETSGWFNPSELAQLPLSATGRKLVKQLISMR